jgi:hypothetical protein
MSHDRGCFCGRERSEYDSCTESLYAKKSTVMEELDKASKLYLWVKKGCESMIVSTLDALYKDCRFDCNNDKLYELGPEVKLTATVVAMPVRSNKK